MFQEYLKAFEKGFRRKKGEFNPWFDGAFFPPSSVAAGRMRLVKTLETAQKIKAKKILDIAGGNGYLSSALWREGKEIVLNDIRNLSSDILRWKNGKKIKTIWKNILDVAAAKTGKFDLVLACEVLEHVANGPAFMRHLKSFLAPGGYLILTTPNGEMLEQKLPTFSKIKNFKNLERKQFKPDSDGHLYLYTANEVTLLLKKVGFKLIKVQYINTPFISGFLKFRFLPHGRFLNWLYLQLDSLLMKFGVKAQSKFCAQMIVMAKI